MKTALDFYERGKQKEVNADEYDRSRYYSRNRFICPECGEAVYLTGNKDSNHFTHFRQSDVYAECDRRVDSIPTNSVYERIGLPIYMRQNASGDFNLSFRGRKDAVSYDHVIKEAGERISDCVADVILEPAKAKLRVVGD